ncbi:putative protein ycf45 [Sesamum angolense]|uniref:Uncharacterized protein n=1 Tax=Sesamum angolense TaxID=2727404 RepID=A0AAE1W135_9LAMI|nr:putative protein ycf45 [Sesamum angolense]
MIYARVFCATQIGLNSWRIDSDFFNLVDCCLTQAMKLEVMGYSTSSNRGARRLQVPDPCMKHKVMIEAVDNHMPEVTLDLGRLPQACYLGDSGKRDLRKKEVSIEELEYAQNALGEFGGNNRTGGAGTLHRISAIRNKNGRVVGLTCRLGRPIREIIDMTRDLLEYGKSILFLGRPGVGKLQYKRDISCLVIRAS